MYYAYEVWNCETLMMTSIEYDTLNECREASKSLLDIDDFDIAYICVDDDRNVKEINTLLTIPTRYQIMIDLIKTEQDLDFVLGYLDKDPDDLDWDTNVEVYSMAYRKIYRKQED